MIFPSLLRSPFEFKGHVTRIGFLCNLPANKMNNHLQCPTSPRAIDALNSQVAGKVGLVSAFETSQDFSELKILHFRFNIGIASAFFIQFC